MREAFCGNAFGIAIDVISHVATIKTLTRRIVIGPEIRKGTTGPIDPQPFAIFSSSRRRKT
jgi:hypothetical protein